MSFKEEVGSAKVEIFSDKDKLFVNTSKVEKCRYAFYLYNEKKIIQKIYYSSNNFCCFDVSLLKGKNNFFGVKVFYKKNDEKLTNTVSNINLSSLEANNYLPLVARDDITDFSLQECEIINSNQDKIHEQETLGFRPRKDCDYYSLNLPIDWKNDPFGDKNWMFQLNAWRMLDPYLSRFNKSDVDFVSSVINDFVDFEKKNNNEWLWYDMSAGLRALKISFFIKKCKALKLDHKINDLHYLINQHIKHLSDPNELNSGNHGLFQLNGLKSIIFLFSSSPVSKLYFSDLAVYANEKMSDLIKRQLGKYGVHTECSPDYHFFTHKKINNIIASPWWRDISKESLSLLIKGEYAKAWLTFPNKRCVPVGDSSCGAVLKNLPKLYDWPHHKNGKYLGARLDGYSVVRSDSEVNVKNSSFLFFTGAFHSSTHKHCDDLSFVLQEKNLDILIDSGKYGYKHDSFRKYFLSSKAHNTIVVDDMSSSRRKNDAYGSAINGEPRAFNGFWIMEGYVNHSSNNYSHLRQIFYKPGEDLYVIDLVKNGLKHDLREVSLYWHLDPTAQTVVTDSKVHANILNKFDFIVKVSCINEDLKINRYYGYEKDADLVGWVSKKYLDAEPTTTLRFQSTLSRENIFLTRISMGAADSHPLLEIVDGGIQCNEQWVYEKLSLKIKSFVNLSLISKDDISSTLNVSTTSASTVNKNIIKYFGKPLNHTAYNLSYFVFKNISHYFKQSNKESKTLLVTFHGSIAPPKENKPGTQLPCFRLYNLEIEKQPHLLCFSDMLLDIYKDDGVYLSWFLDSEKHRQKEKIIEIVKIYSQFLNVNEIVFHGSSGGGHPSLYMASYFNEIAIVSNAQFYLDKHSQYSDLIKGVHNNGDRLLKHDLESQLNGLKGPKKFISYCNTDDYTLEHHVYANTTIENLFPGTVEEIFFSGEAIAKEKGIRNHSVGYPGGLNFRDILFSYMVSR